MHDRWTESNNAIAATFTFSDFTEAIGFVNSVGDVCEEHQHHPDICIRNYNEVHISSTTHDQGNVVTDKDRKLAEAIDAIAAE